MVDGLIQYRSTIIKLVDQLLAIKVFNIFQFEPQSVVYPTYSNITKGKVNHNIFINNIFCNTIRFYLDFQCFHLIPAVKNIISQTLMFKKHTFACLVVVALALSLASAENINYYKSSADYNTRSSFSLNYVPSGYPLIAIINSMGAQLPYTIELWAPNSAYPGTPFQTTQLTGTATFTSNLLPISGSWRLVVAPSSTAFMFQITIQSNGSNIGTFTDVARNYRSFVIYYKAQGSYNLTLNIPSGYGNQVFLNVYGPFTNLGFGGALYDSTQGTNSLTQTITCNTLANQYYFAEIVQQQSVTSLNININFKFTTDMYQCPYDQQFRDYNSIFQGCSNTLPTQGYPCTDYNNIVATCLTCDTGYSLNSYGQCIQDTNCPKGQYFSFGDCYDVIANCLTYNHFKGQCYSCNSGYDLSQINGFQACILKAVTCQNGQYIFNNTCMNYVANCEKFQNSTGQCINCQKGYQLSNNLCKVIVLPSNGNCQLGYTFQSSSGTCVPIDSNCVYYYPNNTCMLCMKGYTYMNSICTQIICGPRQYSGLGYCVDVSIFCQTFQPVQGNCLTCIPLYFLQNDGTCLQSVQGQSSNTGSNTTCPQNYYLRSGTCVQKNPLCSKVDIPSGNCLSCINSSYFLSNGNCIAISSFCTTYRTYFSDGNCFPVSIQCDEYDPSNGYCLSCRDNLVLSADGRCIYNEVCGNRQYPSPIDGSCQAVSSQCGNYSQTNGTCLDCADSNYQINTGGVCCYKFNYLLVSQCVQFLKQNCTSVRPQFGNCLSCSAGYNQTYGYFGRCNIISNSTSQ